MRTKPQLLSIFRSSRSAMFFKIGILKNFSNFTGKHLLESLFNKVAELQAFFHRTPPVAASGICQDVFLVLGIQNFFIYNAYLVIWKVLPILGNSLKIHFLKNFTTLSRIRRYLIHYLTNVQLTSFYASDSCRLI